MGLDAACEAAARCAAALIDRGVNVYSPIVHSHPIGALVKSFDQRDNAWLTIELAFMRPAKGLIVMKLASWDCSRGISWEKQWFSERGLPIYHIDDPLPDELPGGLKCLP